MTRDAFVNCLSDFSVYKFAGACLLVFDGATSHLHTIGEATVFRKIAFPFIATCEVI
jgi:hypothetical protein